MISRLRPSALGLIGAVFAGFAGPVPAQEGRDFDRLISLLNMQDTVTVMHLEGLRYGEDLAREFLSDTDTRDWSAVVAQIYDEDRMLSRVSDDFEEALKGVPLAPILSYFEQDAAQDIITLELQARHAFLSREVEAAATRTFQTLARENPRLAEQVEQIIDDSDLVDFNVMGTLNASLMFYRGLREGGAYDVTEDEIFADVWATEEATRQSSYEWLGAFLSLAYETLDPETLDDYVAFYRTEEGQDLNRALFAAFDGMYEDLSFLMGYALANQLTSTPL